MSTTQATIRRQVQARDKRIDVAGVLVVALFLRLARLPFASVWPDERITIDVLSRVTLWQTITELPFFQPHPPIYYFLLKTIFNVTGQSIMVGRLLSILVSGGSVLALYWLVKELHDHYTGIISALFLAWHPFHLYLATTMRMYAFVGLLSIGSIGFLLLYTERNDYRYLLASVSTTLVALYTHWFGFFLVAVVGIVVLKYAYDSQTDALILSLLGVGTLPGYAIVYYRVFDPVQAERYVSGGTGEPNAHLPRMTHIVEAPELVDVVGLYSRFAVGRIFWVWEYAVAAGIIALAIYGLYVTERDVILSLWLVLPVLLAVVLSYTVFPIWRGRYLVIAAMPLIILLAQGIRRLPVRWQPAVVCGLLGLSSTTVWLASFVGAAL